MFAGKRSGIMITGGDVDLDKQPLNSGAPTNVKTDLSPDFSAYEVGYDIPAVPGMHEADIQPPCLILDLDALERNARKTGDYAKAHGMRLRAVAFGCSRIASTNC